MDKYEFNIKVEQIKKLVNKSDYETAMKIADSIDWRRVRNTNLLSLISQIYEKNEEYQEAKAILLLAFERAPMGKRLLFKLADLALRESNTKEAEAYYREFCELAPDDSRQYLLRYLILKQKNAPMEQLIHSLESYISEELDEKWLYELAELYQQAGDIDHCIKTCDKIMLMFGLGKYVDKAMELKLQHAPLSQYQMDLVENRDKYEEKLRAVAHEFSENEPVEEYIEESEIQKPEPHIPNFENEDVVADYHQAAVEEKLAEEISRMSIEEIQEEHPAERTRVLEDLHSLKNFTEMTADSEVVTEVADKVPEEAQPHVIVEEDKEPEIAIEEADNSAEELEEDPDEEPVKITNHLMIESITPEKGLELAIDTLKQIHKETGSTNQVIKISGKKLNQKGITAIADKLKGRDLIVEAAGDLTETSLEELNDLMDEDESGMVVVLIDNPKQLEELHASNSVLASKFDCIGIKKDVESDVEKAVMKEVDRQEKAVREEVLLEQSQPLKQSANPEKEKAVNPDEEMGIDEFAQYACQYAKDIDCSITGKSMLALYERIEIMEEDGIPLTRINAEDLIEEAADRAEKPSLGKWISGIFSSKYDKDGLLILKEEHFIH